MSKFHAFEEDALLHGRATRVAQFATRRSIIAPMSLLARGASATFTCRAAAIYPGFRHKLAAQCRRQSLVDQSADFGLALAASSSSGERPT